MKIALAQTAPFNKSVDQNVTDHEHWINQAGQHGADLILFPEMSLTGYTRKEAASLAFYPNDKRLASIKKLAQKWNIIIVAGAPICIENKLYIGSFILFPDQSEKIYTKQFLHSGEELYFKASFDYNPIVTLNDHNISLAICADIDHPKHAQVAAKNNNALYLASIFFTPNGIDEAHEKLSNYAKVHQMPTLMANFCQNSFGLEAAGKSAAWDSNGQLIGELNSSSGLIVIERKESKWHTKTDQFLRKNN